MSEPLEELRQQIAELKTRVAEVEKLARRCPLDEKGEILGALRDLQTMVVELVRRGES